MNSSAAISGLDKPVPTSWATSVSRLVSPSAVRASAGGVTAWPASSSHPASSAAARAIPGPAPRPSNSASARPSRSAAAARSPVRRQAAGHRPAAAGRRTGGYSGRHFSAWAGLPFPAPVDLPGLPDVATLLGQPALQPGQGRLQVAGLGRRAPGTRGLRPPGRLARADQSFGQQRPPQQRVDPAASSVASSCQGPRRGPCPDSPRPPGTPAPGPSPPRSVPVRSPGAPLHPPPAGPAAPPPGSGPAGHQAATRCSSGSS